MALDRSWIELAGAVLSGGVVTEAFGYLRRRGQDRKIAVDQVQEAARELIQTALSAAEGQVKRLESEVAALRDEVADLRRRHANCEKRTAELEDEIARLMAGAPATYKPTDLKRVGSKR